MEPGDEDEARREDEAGGQGDAGRQDDAGRGKIREDMVFRTT